jgi:hypothetical protein
MLYAESPSIVISYLFHQLVKTDITDLMMTFDIVNFPWVNDLADNSSIIFQSYAGRFCQDVRTCEWYDITFIGRYLNVSLFANFELNIFYCQYRQKDWAQVLKT